MLEKIIEKKNQVRKSRQSYEGKTMKDTKFKSYSETEKTSIEQREMES